MPTDTLIRKIELNTPKSDFKTGTNLLLGSIAPTFTGLGLLAASYSFKGEAGNSMRAGGIGCLGIAAVVKATGIMYLVRGGKRSNGKVVPSDL